MTVDNNSFNLLINSALSGIPHDLENPADVVVVKLVSDFALTGDGSLLVDALSMLATTAADPEGFIRGLYRPGKLRFHGLSHGEVGRHLILDAAQFAYGASDMARLTLAVSLVHASLTFQG